MRFMKDYENYDEWLQGREAVRNTLHILDKCGSEVPDNDVDIDLSCAFALRVDDGDAMEFLYAYHCSCDLFGHKYDSIRDGLNLVIGDTYAYDLKYGWIDVTELMRGLVPAVQALAERYAA